MLVHGIILNTGKVQEALSHLGRRPSNSIAESAGALQRGGCIPCVRGVTPDAHRAPEVTVQLSSGCVDRRDQIAWLLAMCCRAGHRCAIRVSPIRLAERGRFSDEQEGCGGARRASAAAGCPRRLATDSRGLERRRPRWHAEARPVRKSSPHVATATASIGRSFLSLSFLSPLALALALSLLPLARTSLIGWSGGSGSSPGSVPGRRAPGAAHPGARNQWPRAGHAGTSLPRRPALGRQPKSRSTSH